MSNKKEIIKETFNVGESIMVDTSEKFVSVPSTMKEEDYPEDVKELIKNGYKVQLNLL